MKEEMTDLMKKAISSVISSMGAHLAITFVSSSPALLLREELTVTQNFSGEKSGWIELAMELFTGINLAEANMRSIHTDELEEAVFMCLSDMSRDIARELTQTDNFASQKLQFGQPRFDPASRKHLGIADKHYLEVLVHGIGLIRMTVGLSLTAQSSGNYDNAFACSGYF